MPVPSFPLAERLVLIPKFHACPLAAVSAGLCAMLFAAANASAAPKPPPADVAADFRALAQQRPWRCADQSPPDVPSTAWTAAPAECTWQNRLQMRRWSGQGGLAPGACVSTQAKWWTWARAGSAVPQVAAAWRTNWTGQSVVGSDGQQQRIAILRQLADGQWSMTEWRWDPSPRAATRRWQQGRWNLLAARAAQLRAPVAAPSGASEARMLRSVLESNLGERAGETDGQTWHWQSDALCLQLDAVGLGQQIMQLPYAVDDSRMEQRAAMQLQLARRYPKATWLTEFALVPAPVHARGGAKFYAVWREQAVVKGQLWMPTKGNGPLVRLRITTALPLVAGGQPEPQAVARAHQQLQRELAGLATRWGVQHE